jgi:replicative DNA helicase
MADNLVAVDIERIVLASMLYHQEVMDYAVSLLAEEDFGAEAHRVIWAEIGDRYINGESCDYEILRDAITRGRNSWVCEPLFEIYSGVATTKDISRYVEVLQERSLLRRLKIAGQKIQAAASDASKPADEILSDAEAAVYSAGVRRSEQVESVGQVSARTQRVIERGVAPAILTGFSEVDDLLVIEPTDMVIIAARPSMGKTAFGLRIMRNIATSGGVSLFFSLEMSKEPLTLRLHCSEARVDMHAVRKGLLTQSAKAGLAVAAATIAKLPIYLDDRGGIRVQDIWSTARRVACRHGLSAIFVDYLQLIAGNAAKGKNRVEEVTEISRGLKSIAKDLKVPVIALSQLSRATENRPVRKGQRRGVPQMSDLRESGAIEQDADAVMFLYRPEYYNAKPEDEGILEVILGKQRNGPVGMERLYFEKSTGYIQRYVM